MLETRKIFKKDSVENLKTLKKEIERHFRTLPRFGAFYARDTKFRGLNFNKWTK